jgi:hypothetical protein
VRREEAVCLEGGHAVTFRRSGVDPQRGANGRTKPLRLSNRRQRGQPVPAEANKELVRQLVEEVVNRRNADALDELADGQFVKLARRWISPFRSSFPDFSMEIIELVAEGDKVSATSSARARIEARGWAFLPLGAASRGRRDLHLPGQEWETLEGDRRRGHPLANASARIDEGPSKADTSPKLGTELVLTSANLPALRGTEAGPNPRCSPQMDLS